MAVQVSSDHYFAESNAQSASLVTFAGGPSGPSACPPLFMTTWSPPPAPPTASSQGCLTHLYLTLLCPWALLRALPYLLGSPAGFTCNQGFECHPQGDGSHMSAESSDFSPELSPHTFTSYSTSPHHGCLINSSNSSRIKLLTWPSKPILSRGHLDLVNGSWYHSSGLGLSPWSSHPSLSPSHPMLRLLNLLLSPWSNLPLSFTLVATRVS